MLNAATTNYDKVKEALKLSWTLRLHPTTPFIPLFRSETGIGKTTMVYDAAKELAKEGFYKDEKGNTYTEAQVFYVNLASKDATDFGGFPVIMKQEGTVQETNGDVHVKMILLDDLAELLTADKPTLFFLDEWNRFKDIGILQVIFEILRRRFNGQRMSDLVYFCAAENPSDSDEGNYFVMEPDSALIDRVYPINLTKDFISFRNYMYDKPYNQSLVNALLTVLEERSQYFQAFSNRTLESVIAVLDAAGHALGYKLSKTNFAYSLIAEKTSASFAETLFDEINDLNMHISEIIKDGKINKQKIDMMKPYKKLALVLSVTDFYLTLYDEIKPEIVRKTGTDNYKAKKYMAAVEAHTYTKNYKKFMDVVSENAAEFLQTVHSKSGNLPADKQYILANILLSEDSDLEKLMIMYGINPAAIEEAKKNASK